MQRAKVVVSVLSLPLHRVCVLTSSPSLRSLGAATKAKLRVRSWEGFLMLCRMRVSPESTCLTFASMRAMLREDGDGD